MALEPEPLQNPSYYGEVLEKGFFDRIADIHGGRTAAEVKEDGIRLLVKKKGGEVALFTRQGKHVDLRILPELFASLAKLPDCTLDSELHAAGMMSHGERIERTMRRINNKYGTLSDDMLDAYLTKGLIEENPVAVRLFDVLDWEGNSLRELPYEERRAHVEAIAEGAVEGAITPSRMRIVSSGQELGDLFARVLDEGEEGLVCKRPGSLYIPNSHLPAEQRSLDWIKIKRAEPIDAVVLGVYLGEDKDIEQLLCGTYNRTEQHYETLAVVNAKRHGLDETIAPLLLPKLRKSCPSNVIISRRLDAPDRYVTPERSIVVEIAGKNITFTKSRHTCGERDKQAYSLSIAHITRIRDDKSISEATTSEGVAILYQQQRSRGGL